MGAERWGYGLVRIMWVSDRKSVFRVVRITRASDGRSDYGVVQIARVSDTDLRKSTVRYIFY